MAAVALTGYANMTLPHTANAVPDPSSSCFGQLRKENAACRPWHVSDSSCSLFTFLFRSITRFSVSLTLNLFQPQQPRPLLSFSLLFPFFLSFFRATSWKIPRDQAANAVLEAIKVRAPRLSPFPCADHLPPPLIPRAGRVPAHRLRIRFVNEPRNLFVFFTSFSRSLSLTSQDYGNEAEVGAGLRAAFEQGLVKREDMWITSKLWNTNHAKEHVRMNCERTLKDLGLT